MIEISEQTGQQRIVVGLKSASDVERAMAAATVLATVIEAEIVGLFVQEEAMLDLAEFPFARVLDFDSPNPREVSRKLMQEAFTRTAAICKQSLLSHASKAQVRWSFSTELGDFNATVKASAGSGDFVVLPGETHGIGTRALINALRKLPDGIKGVIVAALHRGSHSTGPVVAIDDGDQAGAQTVALAGRIAAIGDKSLHLFAIASSNAGAARIADRAAKLTSKGQTIATHRHVPGLPQSIAAGLAHLSPSFVLGDLDGEPFRDDKTAVSLFRAARAPFLLLRARQQD